MIRGWRLGPGGWYKGLSKWFGFFPKQETGEIFEFLAVRVGGRKQEIHSLNKRFGSALTKSSVLVLRVRGDDGHEGSWFAATLWLPSQPPVPSLQPHTTGDYFAKTVLILVIIQLFPSFIKLLSVLAL